MPGRRGRFNARIGKAVEINALWVNGLAALQALHARLGEDSPETAALHERARSSFAARFPSLGGGLYVVVDGPTGDADTVRPNQLLAFRRTPARHPAAVGVIRSPRAGRSALSGRMVEGGITLRSDAGTRDRLVVLS